MDLSPIIISIKTASVSIVITFFLGIWLARAVVSMKSERWKMILDGILTLPLAIYSEVAANNMAQAGKYVAVIVAVSFLIVVGMNYVGRDKTRDVAKNRAKDRIKTGIKG